MRIAIQLPLAATLLLAAATAFAPSVASAALGGDVASALRDHDELGTSRTVTSGASYDLYEGRTLDGVELREYVNRDGRVFAISWRGPRTPNIQALLGESAARYLDASRVHAGGHHLLQISEPDLEIAVLRMPRGWQGHALLPAALPAGINRSELR